jgi:Cdc6-like AAA superfamily ATPase
MNTDELKHLQPSCRSGALLTNDERIHWLRQERWIQYPCAQRVVDRLMELVDYPPRDCMPALVIYGATGMGKTRIIQKFLRDHRAHFDKKIGRTCLPFKLKTISRSVFK